MTSIASTFTSSFALGLVPFALKGAALLLWLCAVACGRRTDLAHGLSIAVFWMGLPIPAGHAQRLLEPSWLLSLSATLGLGYLRPLDRLWPDRMQPGSPLRTRLFDRLRSMLSATTGATLATAPLTALWFGQFVATGVIANCIVVPLGELLVLPITSPADAETGLGAVSSWLPEGRWTDFFTNVTYAGERMVQLHRPIGQYPVLARAGAIVPLTGPDELGVGNPASFEVHVFTGADGEFTLYEDDDAAVPRVVRTRLAWNDDEGEFTIGAAEGELDVVPSAREWTVVDRKSVV